MVLAAIIGTLFNTPVLVGLFIVVFCASIGISLGVRRAYIKVLLKIFEVRIRCPFVIQQFVSSIAAAGCGPFSSKVHQHVSRP